MTTTILSFQTYFHCLANALTEIVYPRSMEIHKPYDGRAVNDLRTCTVDCKYRRHQDVTIKPPVYVRYELVTFKCYVIVFLTVVERT